jgi:hypothetical protein
LDDAELLFEYRVVDYNFLLRIEAGMVKFKVALLQVAMILLLVGCPVALIGGAFCGGVLREAWEWLMTGVVYLGLFWAIGWGAIGWMSLIAICADKIEELNYSVGWYTNWFGFNRVRSPYHEVD